MKEMLSSKNYETESSFFCVSQLVGRYHPIMNQARNNGQTGKYFGWQWILARGERVCTKSQNLMSLKTRNIEEHGADFVFLIFWYKRPMSKNVFPLLYLLFHQSILAVPFFKQHKKDINQETTKMPIYSAVYLNLLPTGMLKCPSRYYKLFWLTVEHLLVLL